MTTEIKIWDNHRRLWLAPMSIDFSSDGKITRVSATEPGANPLSDGFYTYEGNDLDIISIIGDISFNERILPEPTKKNYNKSATNPKYRCMPSEIGLNNGVIPMQHKNRKGTIIGKSRDGLSYRLLWDGSPTPRSYSKSFITVLDEVAQ